MRSALAAAACLLLAACSRQAPPPKAASQPAGPARITQFYANSGKLSLGEKTLLCYGVENAKAVWLTPPRQELYPAITRCLEVAPSATTTYTLTAQGADGPPATLDVIVAVGPPRAHIVDITVSSLDVARGTPVNICYRVENVRSVRIDPIRFTGGAGSPACATDRPLKTTTYTVVAIGAGDSRDEEKVTVKVR